MCMDEHLSVITGYWKTINLPVRVLSYSFADVVGNVLDENVHRSRYFTGIFINVNPCVTFYIFLHFQFASSQPSKLFPWKHFSKGSLSPVLQTFFQSLLQQNWPHFFLHHTHKSPNNLYIVPVFIFHII